MGSPREHLGPLPTRADGMWVAQRRLIFAPGDEVETGVDAPQVFGLRETSIRALWGLGHVRFERYREASRDAAEAAALRAEADALRAEVDALRAERDALAEVVHAQRPRVAACQQLVDSILALPDVDAPAGPRKRSRRAREAS